MSKMPQPNPSILGLEEIRPLEPAVSDFVEFGSHDSESGEEPIAVEIIASDLGRTFSHLKPQVVVVLVRLPARLAYDLEAIASSEPSTYTEYSSDLMQKYSCIGFKGHEFEVGLDLWSLHRFPGAVGDGVVVVAFIAGDKIAIRHLESDDELFDSCQVACISGGENYKPRDDWSEEELAAAQNAPDVVDDKVVTVRTYLRLSPRHSE